MKIATFIAAAGVALSALPQEADAHAFLLLPKAQFTVPDDKRNHNAYVVPGDKAPPTAPYILGRDEENARMFKASYKNINPPSLRDFILRNQVPATDRGIPSGGTAECGFSKPNGPAQPLPDHIEFGNFNLQISGGLHPGPCEAWCDNEIVVPFTEDCRSRFQKPIPYDKAKCVGKSRFTFYWLASHFAPFQVYIGCVPLQGGGGGGGGNNGPGPTPSPAPSPPNAQSPTPTPQRTQSPPTQPPQRTPSPTPSPQRTQSPPTQPPQRTPSPTPSPQRTQSPPTQAPQPTQVPPRTQSPSPTQQTQSPSWQRTQSPVVTPKPAGQTGSPGTGQRSMCGVRRK